MSLRPDGMAKRAVVWRPLDISMIHGSVSHDERQTDMLCTEASKL